MTAELPAMPVEECVPDVLRAIGDAVPVILRAPPGAGKTTVIPRVVRDSDALNQGQILLIQPRRLAARASAARLSHLAGETIGETYGYHVRFDRVIGKQTQVIAMTTGILLRRLADDPLLENVDCVILDEFHERSLEVDLALGMLQRIRTTFRPELRLIVMSATLESKTVAGLLTDAAMIESAGRSYPVEIRYQRSLDQSSRSSAAIAAGVADRLPQAIAETDGDVLVFLPGVGEIRRTAETITPIADRNGVEIHQLYGGLDPAQQDAVLAPSVHRRVVLATNVAETSVTLPNVTAVIDSGLARVLRFESAIGIPSLRIEPISKASADQRAGRAGRTGPGICYRLWPKAMHGSRSDFTAPEIAKADLSSALLTLFSWGEKDVSEFPWLTAPSMAAVESAKRLLILLGAIDEHCALTAVGTRMSRLPVHPRLARMLITAEDGRCLAASSLAAALLSERSPFGRSGTSGAVNDVASENDVLNQVLRLASHFRGRRDTAIRVGAANSIRRVAKSLFGNMKKGNAFESELFSTSWDSPPVQIDLTRALVAAYPDRVAKRRQAGSNSGVMVGGRGVKLDRDSSVKTSELFVCLNVDGKSTESLVSKAAAIQPRDLPESFCRSEREIFFHPSQKSVVARDRQYYLDLMLDESPATCEPDEQSAAMLARHARQHWDQVLPKSNKSLHSFLDRWRFLGRFESSGELPLAAEEALDQVLGQFCQTRLSFKELASAPWLDYLKSLFSYQQLQWLEQQAPESIQVPSGNHIRLTYAESGPPVLAVRIQEIYGWDQSPRLAGGNVTVQLHLLGPNHRPQQITDDLPSFWSVTYPEIRKELKRRYAKHHWPDDPATAKATANGLKPRK